MAKQLPASIIIEKNRIETEYTWLVMLDIVLPDSTLLYLVRNNEDVTFNSTLYVAIPFTIEPTKETTKGQINTVTLKVSNITRIIQSYIEDQNGGIGSSVKVRFINNIDLSGTTDYSELELDFTVLSTNSDTQWVSFTLGTGNPLNKRFPLDRYLANHCGFKFNNLSGQEGTSPECGYSGSETSCNRTLSDCQARNNSSRFGGFLGLGKGGVRIA